MRKIEDEENYRRQVLTTQTSVIEKPVYITEDFKSSPVSITCPFCGKAITTRTKAKFNFVACCCFLFFGVLYCCVQIFGDKNPCCCDITHICPNCGKIVGHYDSC